MPYYQIADPGTEDWITHADNELAQIAGFPGNVWKTDNTAWAERVGATEITKEEAQALVDTTTIEALANWNPNSGLPEPMPIAFS